MKKAIFSATALIIFSASAMANDIAEKNESKEVKRDVTVKVNVKEVQVKELDCVDRYYIVLYDYSWMSGNSEVFIANAVYDNCMLQSR